MKHVPLKRTSLLTIVDDEYYDLIWAKGPWRLSSGYASMCGANINGITFMHHVITGFLQEGYEVHHINDNKLDNRRENLDVITKARHRQLRAKAHNGTIGVRFDKSVGKWKAHITFQGRGKFLGFFPGPTEAALAYDQKAKEVYGEDAVLNFP